MYIYINLLLSFSYHSLTRPPPTLKKIIGTTFGLILIACSFTVLYIFSHSPVNESLDNGVFAATCQACGHFFKFKASPQLRSDIKLKINGKEYTGNLASS